MPSLLQTYRPLQQIVRDPIDLLEKLRFRRTLRPALQKLNIQLYFTTNMVAENKKIT